METKYSTFLKNEFRTQTCQYVTVTVKRKFSKLMMHILSQ